MKNLKKILALALVVAITATASIAGTLAYLTDRDSKANVFTVGDVQIELNDTFEQGSQLVPGVVIEKEASITNTGKNDAWVWLTLAVPTAFDNAQNPFLNLTTGNAADWTELANPTTETIDGKEYVVYTLLYNELVKPDETTSMGLTTVGLDSHVDVDPEGNAYWVEAGVATDLGWNINEESAPVVYVGAYAIQSEGFTTVEEAYAAYAAQWTTAEGENKGTEWADAPTVVSTVAELKTALKTKDSSIILDSGTYDMGGNYSIAEGVELIGAENVVIKGTLTSSLKNVTVKNVTFESGNAQRWAYASGNLTFEDCTFNGTSVYAIHYDGTTNADILYKNCEITGWVAIAGGHKSLTFDGCTINGNGAYGVIRTYDNATIKNCTFDVENVNKTDVYQDGIHAVDCTITVENCTNVNGNIEDLFNVSGTGKIEKK